MSKLVKVAIDLDDVVVDFFARVVKCYNTEYGETVTIDQITGWDENPIKLSHHFGKGRAYRDWWAWWRARRELWGTCSAIPGAIGGLTELHHRGHYVELLTSKPDWAKPAMNDWLSRWHPYYDRLTVVQPTESKLDFSDASLIVDDKPSTCAEWGNAGRGALLFYQPWNGYSGAVGRGVVRALNWSHVLEWLETPRLERLMKGDL